MGITKAAVELVNTLANVMNHDALRQARIRAVEIAQERGATRVGENHLKQALQEFAEGVTYHYEVEREFR